MLSTLDAVLDAHRDALGADFTAYRNHACRVAHLCLRLSVEQPDRLEKVAIAAACHDLGIWTDHTFDYLEPSIRLAHACLAAAGRREWSDEITAMIREHHKVLPWRGRFALVEAFRRADWIDVSQGVLAGGRQRPLVRALYARWPAAGFHRRLVQLTLQRWRAHPLSPLPMLRI